MTPRVKICGVTNPGDRDAAIAAGADALGFTVDVTVETPREITVDRAADLIAGVPPFVTTVVVTMPDDPRDAVDLLGRTGAEAVQIHGDLPPDDVEAIREATGRRVVVAVDAEDDDADRYDGAADALLVDSAREGGGGGTGRTHDWDRTRALRESLDAPLVLAGGLAPDNVAEAVRTVEPFGVDVASGVEASGGRKDHDAVAAFVGNAKRASGAIRS